jgi:hypothetical protein
MIPVGNHRLSAVYLATNDTVASYVSVLPGGTSYTTLRFPGALWAATSSESEEEQAGLQYVDGSAKCPGGANEDVHFKILNASFEPVTIYWIVVSYEHTPTAYFENVRWGNNLVFSSSDPRAASGDTLVWSSPKTLNPVKMKMIKLQNFRDIQAGGGAKVDMSYVDFTITFSDGSVLTFNSGS